MSALVFQAHDGQLVKLSAACVRDLHEFRQTAPRAAEAGGVLLGRWIGGTRDVVVDEITRPMQDDRRARSSFYRHWKAHQKRVDEAFAESDGTCGYVGEWHTHPESVPTPSWTDRCDWRRRLRQDRVDVPFVFFVIVGLDETRIWRGSRGRLVLEPMKECDVLDADS